MISNIRLPTRQDKTFWPSGENAVLLLVISGFVPRSPHIVNSVSKVSHNRKCDFPHYNKYGGE